MESKYIQGIQRKINEIAKDYKSKGYEVIIEPNNSRIPNFIRNFQPDLIALSKDDNVAVEVKSSDSKTDFKSLENLANLVNSRDNWRFELVFTNPKNRLNIENELVVIDLAKIKSRISECESLINNDSYDSAFLLGWSTLEAAIRMRLTSINENEIDEKKPPLHLIKNLFSYGIINQSLLRKIEFLNQLRNKLIHGFETQISKNYVLDLLEIIENISGQNDNSDISNWISCLDLDGYEEIYALYKSVSYIEEYGLFTTYEKNGKIYVKSDVQDQILEIESKEQQKAMLEIIEDDYMDGMDSEGFYGFHRAMEKDN
jgi:uncharacterized protein YutE (UPF0331/DUF86 family)